MFSNPIVRCNGAALSFDPLFDRHQNGAALSFDAAQVDVIDSLSNDVMDAICGIKARTQNSKVSILNSTTCLTQTEFLTSRRSRAKS